MLQWSVLQDSPALQQSSPLLQWSVLQWSVLQDSPALQQSSPLLQWSVLQDSPALQQSSHLRLPRRHLAPYTAVGRSTGRLAAH